jgi:hypothetical protein
MTSPNFTSPRMTIQRRKFTVKFCQYDGQGMGPRAVGSMPLPPGPIYTDTNTSHNQHFSEAYLHLEIEQCRVINSRQLWF